MFENKNKLLMSALKVFISKSMYSLFIIIYNKIIDYFMKLRQKSLIRFIMKINFKSKNTTKVFLLLINTG